MTSLFNLFLIAALPLQIQTSPIEQSPSIETYCNERFHFCSQYPSEILPTQEDFRQGDGLLMKTENDLATVIVAGYHDFHGEGTQEIFGNELKKLAPNGERSVMISSLFGEDFYECFFMVGTRSYFHKAYLYNGKMILLSIETTINQPKLMQKLRGNITLYFPEKNNGTLGTSLTGRE